MPCVSLVISFETSVNCCSLCCSALIVSSSSKKPDFNYITTTNVDHEDGAVDISCYIDNTEIISRYEIDRSERETNNFLNITSIPFPNSGDMIYYHDIGVETKDHF